MFIVPGNDDSFNKITLWKDIARGSDHDTIDRSPKSQEQPPLRKGLQRPLVVRSRTMAPSCPSCMFAADLTAEEARLLSHLLKELHADYLEGLRDRNPAVRKATAWVCT